MCRKFGRGLTGRNIQNSIFFHRSPHLPCRFLSTPPTTHTFYSFYKLMIRCNIMGHGLMFHKLPSITQVISVDPLTFDLSLPTQVKNVKSLRLFGAMQLMAGGAEKCSHGSGCIRGRGLGTAIGRDLVSLSTFLTFFVTFH